MNPWFGPHPADLIRLGAKYTPCMRRHDEVESRYDKQARLEAMSGCCIDPSTSRCMQTSTSTMLGTFLFGRLSVIFCSFSRDRRWPGTRNPWRTQKRVRKSICSIQQCAAWRPSEWTSKHYCLDEQIWIERVRRNWFRIPHGKMSDYGRRLSSVRKCSNGHRRLSNGQ